LSSWVIPAIDVIILIFFLIAVILLVTVSCMFRDEERERVDAEIKQLEEYRE
jgi:hypothetical protein